jgi:hypothetical protein
MFPRNPAYCCRFRSNQLKSQAFPGHLIRVKSGSRKQHCACTRPLHDLPNSRHPVPQHRYTRTAIGLHWLIAIALAGTFALGLYMHELPLSPQKLKLYSWHKWAGVTIFLFVALRLAWRLATARRRCPPGCRPGSAWRRKPRTCCSTC